MCQRVDDEQSAGSHAASSELYRRQVAQGLDGNQQAAQQARMLPREWFGGNIRLVPLADGGSTTHWNQNIGALVSTAVGLSW